MSTKLERNESSKPSSVKKKRRSCRKVFAYVIRTVQLAVKLGRGIDALIRLICELTNL